MFKDWPHQVSIHLAILYMSVECKGVCLYFMYLHAVVCMVQLSSISGLANITVTVSVVQSGPVCKA